MANLADDILMIFFLFSQKQQALTFHANWLLSRQYAWNVKAYFLKKKRKVFEMSSDEFLIRMLSVKNAYWFNVLYLTEL